MVIIREFCFDTILNSDFFAGNTLMVPGTALWCIDIIIGKELMKKRLISKTEEEVPIEAFK